MTEGDSEILTGCVAGFILGVAFAVSFALVAVRYG